MNYSKRNPVPSQLGLLVAVGVLLTASPFLAGYAFAQEQESAGLPPNYTDRDIDLEQTPFPPPIIGGQTQAPDFTIDIPHTRGNANTYEPVEVSVPVGTAVMWINQDNEDHTVTTIEQGREFSPPVSFDSGHIPGARAGLFEVTPFGGSFIHVFNEPGTYYYFCTIHPDHQGVIYVGDTVQTGPNNNMDLIIGADLPFTSNNVSRVLLAVVPTTDVLDLPPTTSIGYEVNISSPVTASDLANQTLPAITDEPAQNATAVGDTGSTNEQMYSAPFTDTDGVLHLELIPSLPSQNATSGFTTWGPDISGSATGPHTGAFHIKGPVLVEDKPYTLTVSITSIDEQLFFSDPIVEEFVLSSEIASIPPSDMPTGEGPQ